MNKAVVKVAVAPLMTKPMKNCELADEVLHGMVVELLEKKEDGFYRVRTPYRYEGFMHETYLNFSEKVVAVWENSPVHVVDAMMADVLSDPKVQGYTICQLVKGDYVIVTGEEEKGWIKVLTADENEGYLRTKFLCQIPTFESQTQEEFRENLVKTAMTYKNAQYRWGGKTHLGIDCSGLLSISYFLNGVHIYRDAKIMEGFPVKEVSFEELGRGDFIFFPGHVAMYLGNKRYIHSSASNDGVYENSLNPADSDYREDLANTITAFGSIFSKTT